MGFVLIFISPSHVRISCQYHYYEIYHIYKKKNEGKLAMLIPWMSSHMTTVGHMFLKNQHVSGEEKLVMVITTMTAPVIRRIENDTTV